MRDRPVGYWEWISDDTRVYTVNDYAVGCVCYLPNRFGLDEGWYAWAQPHCLIRVEDVSEGMRIVELCWR